MTKPFKTYKGCLRLGYLCGSGPDIMRLEIRDRENHAPIMEVDFEPAQFGRLIGSREVDVTIRPVFPQLLGAKYEVKEMEVWAPPVSSYRPEVRELETDSVLASYEVDGWSGRRGDLYNHHRLVRREKRSGVDGYVFRVSFTRYLDEKGNPIKGRESE